MAKWNGMQPPGWPEPELGHPRNLAKDRAHRDHCGRGDDHRDGIACPAQIDPAVEAEMWYHRARMALARRAAGRTLDRADRQALARYEANRGPDVVG